MGDEVVVAMEALKLLLRGALALAEQSGLNDEQFRRAFEAEKAALLNNDPNNLPDI